MKIKKDQIQDIYPLSPLQEGILFHTLAEEDSPAYFEQMSIALEGELDQEILVKAWNTVFERHDALRTAIVYEGLKQPVQVVLKKRSVPFVFENIEHLDQEAQADCILEWRKKDIKTGFDLGREALLRITLFQTGAQSFNLILSHHHIILDGWSVGVLIEDFFKVYASLRKELPIPGEKPPRYREFIKWLKTTSSEESAAYWKASLSGSDGLTSVPAKSKNGQSDSDSFANVEFTLSSAQVQELNYLASHYKVSLNSLIRLIWGILLARYNDTDDVIFGATVSGRPPEIPGIEKMLGVFINTLPVRIQFSEGITLSEMLQNIQAQAFGQDAHQQFSLAKMPATANLKGPLFDHILVFENFPVDEAVTDSLHNDTLGFVIRDMETFSRTNYDLCVVILPGKELRFKISYNESTYAASQIQSLEKHLTVLVETLIQNPRQLVEDVDLITLEEQFQLVNPHGGLNFPPEKTLDSWFEERVNQSPDASAVVFEGESMTYRELAIASDQLATWLQQNGVTPGKLVGLMVKRSCDLIVGILGILKAGGAYVPIDPNSPADRTAFILQDSGIQLLVTQSGLHVESADLNLPVVLLDTQKEAIENCQEPLRRREVDPHLPAYVIYTSGSTGKPKGTLVSHYNAVRLFQATEAWYQFGPSDIWTMFHSYAFDFSVWEIWGALLYGGQVHVIPYSLSRSPEAFYDYLVENRVTVLNQTPTAFRNLVEVTKKRPADEKNNLRYVIFGGEALDLQSLKPWFDRYGDQTPQLINMYGITETTVHVTFRPVSWKDLSQGGSLIGEPIPDLSLYVLDSRMRPVPMGVAGQLFVGGAGVTQGYLNRPELTRTRFIEDPFVDREGKKLYLTGDVVRYLPTGELEYLGRSDRQVKISGFRIEPGEIEALIQRDEEVEGCLVEVIQDEAERLRLSAFVLTPVPDAFDPSEIRKRLLNQLPEYMVPTVFVPLLEFPLTGNGKVDRKALREQIGTLQGKSEEGVAPENEKEAQMAEIWKAVLGLEKLGVTANFFELGGDSIRSIQVIQRAKKIGISLSVKTIFQYPTIRELVEAASAPRETKESVSSKAPFAHIPSEWREQIPENVVDAYPLTRLQAGMLFHSEFSRSATAYHDIFTFDLLAVFHQKAFRQALDRVTERHEILRTAFELSRFEIPLQWVYDRAQIPLEITDLSELSEKEQTIRVEEWIEAEKQRPFQFGKPPLVLFHIHLKGNNRFALSLACHHAILDGWSVASLLAELFKEYRSGEQKSTSQPLSVKFADFVEKEQAALTADQDRTFWKNYIQGLQPLNLPELPAPFQEQNTGGLGAKNLTVPQEISLGLEVLAKKVGAPLKSVLLAAHLKVLEFVCDQGEIVTGLVSNGRLEEKDGEKALGVFLNTLPLRMQMPEGTWKDLVAAVFHQEKNILSHRWFPLNEIQKETDIPHLFETAFNYTHFHIYDQFSKVDGIKVLGTQGFDQTNFKWVTNFSRQVQSGELSLVLQYDPAHFPSSQMDRFLGYFNKVLELMAGISEANHDRVSLLEPGERLVLNQWSQPHIPPRFSEEATIPQLWEAQVAQNRDTTAVVSSSQRLSYGELNERANQWAQYLVQNVGVEKDNRVAVMATRTTGTITAMLAILKAGGAYVPIDPHYPINRIKFLIQDAGCKAIFCDTSETELLTAIQDLRLEGPPVLDPENQPANEGSFSLPDCKANQLAYIIYTSGSTGNPKGVMIEHRSVLHLVEGLYHHLYDHLGSHKRVAVLANFVFDASVQQIFAALLGGHTLFIGSNEQKKDPVQLQEFLRNNQIEVCDGTPSLLSMLVAGTKGALGGPELQQLIIGGEALPATLLRNFYWREGNQGVAIANVYGPTETTVDVTCHNFREAPGKNWVTLGTPLGNTRLWVLGRNGDPLPVGTIGEIVIGGSGVGRGYLNLKTLTREKYTHLPTDSRERVFRTGDLGRWMPDGTLDFIGRKDGQVKVNGYRIEPEEINHHLQTHEKVVQSTVLVRENTSGNAELIAFFVPDGELDTLGAGSLRAHLGKTLPEYMLPATFVPIPRIPLTPSGKVDVRKILAYDGEVLSSGEAYIAPRNEQEALLTEIWGQVLGRDKISIRDNFFVLGGDSIKALQITARLKNQGYDLEIKDLFTYPQIQDLGDRMEKVTVQRIRETVVGKVEMGAIQQWFWEVIHHDPHHFNQSLLLFRKSGVEEKAVREVVKQLFLHHDLLRACFPFQDGKRTQYIPEGIQGEFISVIELEPQSEAGPQILPFADKMQAGLDLEKGPLIHVGIFKHPDGDHILLIVHHLIIDGVSWRILLEDLQGGYDQYLQGENVLFPHKTASFAEWTVQSLEYARHSDLLSQISYWKEVNSQPVAMIADPETPSDNSFGKVKTQHLLLSREKTRSLLTEVNQAYKTGINDVLLTALARLFWGGLQPAALAVMMEGHGREPMHSPLDISRTMGWFTSRFPVVLNCELMDIGTHLKTIKETLRNIPDKGMGYGILKYLTPPDLKQGLSFSLKPQIGFNFLGQFDGPEKQSGFAIATHARGAEDSPRTQGFHPLEIVGFVAEGQMKINISFDPEQFAEEDIQTLLSRYEIELDAIIDHCISRIFPEPTPSDLTWTGFSLAKWNHFLLENNLSPTLIQDIYPLSPMQEGILFHALMDPDSTAYFEQISMTIRGELDFPLLEKTWKEIIARQDILRTNFFSKGLDKPLQVVFKEREFSYQYLDLREVPEAYKETQVAAYKRHDKQKGFNLETGALFRLAVLHLEPDVFELIISNQHIILDGWSISILFNEFFEVYSAGRTGQLAVLPPRSHFREYIKWLQKVNEEDSRAFWRTRLAHYEQTVGIPRSGETDLSVQPVLNEEEVNLSAGLTRQLKSLADAHKMSLNSLLQGIWALVLGSYHDTKDVVFGITVSGRSSEIRGIEKMVGLFINTHPVRISWNQESSLSDFLAGLQEEVFQREAHQYFPLAEIQAVSGLGSNLFDHLLVFENYPVDKQLAQSSGRRALGFLPEKFEIFEQTNYALMITIHSGESIQFRFNYNSRVYQSEIVEAVGQQLIHIAEQVVQESVSTLSQIQFAGANRGWNQDAKFLPTKSIPHRFEERVQQHPDAIALVFEGQSWSYRELNEKANRLAHYLLDQQQVKPQDLIVLYTDRSPWMLIGMLGILKSGAAYLPITPDFPASRINYMLEDSGCKLLLTHSIQKLTFSEGRQVIELESALAGSNHNPEINIQPDFPAYMTYTSGSTGKPKGIQVSHQNVVGFTANLQGTFGFREGESILGVTTFTFDISVLELLCSLMTGLKVVLAGSPEIEEPARLARLIERERIKLVQTTPSRLKMLLDFNDNGFLAPVRVLLVGGEAFPEPLFQQVRSLPDVQVFNVYGPTETTIWSTAKDLSDGVLNIGTPLLQEQVQILSREGQLLPPGGQGEICIAGEGVTLGYWNRPELSLEKFVQLPGFSQGLVYRTGDLGRKNPNGEIEFLGRVDEQVKIRGYRIEPGEIEARLREHPAVQEVVCGVWTTNRGEIELAAWWIPTEGAQIPASKILRSFLAQTLPAYMWPDHYCQIAHFPLNTNGKLDRKQLPDPTLSVTEQQETTELPATQLQQQVARAWKEVLGQKEIGLDDNFFELGGHSLKATQVVSRLFKETGVYLNLRDFFSGPTIRHTVELIENSEQGDESSIPLTPSRPYYPTSSAQKRLWLLDSMETGGSSTYNMPGAVTFHQSIDTECLTLAFQTLLERHESLRTNFKVVGEEPVQIIRPYVVFQIPEEDLRSHPDPEVSAKELADEEAQKPFDLESDVLLRAKLLRIDDEKSVFLFNMHHIISDGWSVQILLQELKILYNAFSKGLKNPLEPLSLQYRDYAEWHNRKSFEQEEAYWMNKLKGRVDWLKLPYDYPLTEVNSFSGGLITRELTPEVTAGLRRLSQDHAISLSNTVLTVFMIFLSKLTGQSNISIAMSIANRNHPDIEQLIGFFVNTLIIHAEIHEEDSLEEMLQQVKHNSYEAFEHQNYPFERLVKNLNPHRYYNHQPLFNVIFGFQNFQNVEVPVRFRKEEDKWLTGDINQELTGLESFDQSYNTSKFDLSLFVYDLGDRIQLSFEYNSERFKASSITQYLTVFSRFLESVVTPQETVNRI